MRIEGDEIAECLHVEDEGGLAMWLQGVEAGLEESCDQPAQLTEITRLSSMAIISRTLDIAADCNKTDCI